MVFGLSAEQLLYWTPLEAPDSGDAQSNVERKTTPWPRALLHVENVRGISANGDAMRRLTTAQRNWLDVAKLAKSFRHAPTPTLRLLEAEGLIEHNPATTGPRTLWLITDKGSKLKVPHG